MSTADRENERNELEEKEQLKRFKVFTTFGIYYTTFAYGCVLAIVGPAIVLLSRKFETGVAEISVAVAIASGAHFLTALLCGLTFNLESGKYRPRRPLTIIALLMWSCGALFFMPHVSSLYGFYILSGVLGVGCGAWSITRVDWLNDLWRDQSRSYVMTQHLWYSVGLLFPALIWSPFLQHGNVVVDNNNHGGVGQGQGQGQGQVWLGGQFLSSLSPAQNSLMIPFSAAGLVLSLAVFVQLTLFFKFRDVRKLFNSTKDDVENDSGSDTSSNHDQLDEVPGPSRRPEAIELQRNPRCQGQGQGFSGSNANNQFLVAPDPPFLGNPNVPQNPVPNSCWPNARFLLERQQFFLKSLTLWLVLMSAAYTGLELATLTFLPAYCVYSPIHLSDFQATAFILSTFTLFHAVGRSLTSLLVKYVSTELLLSGNLMMILMANLMWRLMGENDFIWLWLGSLLMGLGISTMYPTLQLYFEKFCFIKSKLLLASRISEGAFACFFPLILGHSIETFPAILIWINFLSLSVLTTSFVKFQILTAFMAYYGLDEHTEMNTAILRVSAFTGNGA